MSQHDAIIRIKTYAYALSLVSKRRRSRIAGYRGECSDPLSGRQGARQRDINDALNYRTITKSIIQYVENNRFALLEKLTQDVLDIAREHHWVTYAEVEIDKLHALRYADSVSMTLSWQRRA